MKTQRSGRPRGLTRQEAEKRRTRIYALFLRGFSEVEIAESLGINKSNVSRALSTIRKSNARWFRQNLDPNDRFQNLFKTHYDAIWETVRQGWILYHNIPAEKPEVKANVIAKIQNGLGLCSRIVGLGLPSLEEIHQQTQLIELQKESEELQRAFEESKQVGKVHSISGP